MIVSFIEKSLLICVLKTRKLMDFGELKAVCLQLTNMEVADRLKSLKYYLLVDTGSPMYRIPLHVGLGFCLHGPH